VTAKGRPDFLSSLEFLDTKNISTGPNCVRVTLYAYTELYISKVRDTNKVILYCTETTGGAAPPKLTHFLSMVNSKGSETVTISSKDDLQLTRCLQNTTQTFFYQNGFLALADPWLRYYSFIRSYGQTYCDKNFLLVANMSFLAEVEETGIQYIYIINRT
jgi:hypothetical protein